MKTNVCQRSSAKKNSVQSIKYGYIIFSYILLQHTEPNLSRYVNIYFKLVNNIIHGLSCTPKLVGTLHASAHKAYLTLAVHNMFWSILSVHVCMSAHVGRKRGQQLQDEGAPKWNYDLVEGYANSFSHGKDPSPLVKKSSFI